LVEAARCVRGKPLSKGGILGDYGEILAAISNRMP
jgi:hypothetical protein